MGRPTENDWQLFKTVSNSTKVDVLYAYLCLGYNMDEVAKNVLRDYNDMASQRVSNITRCYGFEGKNGGRYRRYSLDRRDIEGFVRLYPNGCYDCSVMDEYVKNIYEKRQASGMQNVPVRQPSQSSTTSWNTGMYTNNTRQNTNYPKRESSSTMSGADSIATIVLIVLFVIFKFFWGWGWIASIIVSILVGGLVSFMLDKFS